MKKVSRLSFPEKREYFGLRKLKVGVASVAIATALFWGAGLTSVSANQATSQAAVSEVINETSLPDDGSQALLEPEKTADANQNLEESNSSDLSDDSQNQLTESESSAVEETVPESQPQEVISQAQGVQGAAEIDEISDVKAVTSAENSNQVNLLKSSQPDNQVSNPPIAEIRCAFILRPYHQMIWQVLVCGLGKMSNIHLNLGQMVRLIFLILNTTLMVIISM